MQRILLYSTLLILAAWSADAAEVRLKSEAVCSGAIVRLKDVAEIVSADENEAAALAELQLFPVPSVGKPRFVRQGEIRELLALSDVNLKAVSLSGAEKLVVRRTGQHAPAKPPAATGPAAASAAVVPTAFITPSTKLPQAGESTGVELIPVTTPRSGAGSHSSQLGPRASLGRNGQGEWHGAPRHRKPGWQRDPPSAPGRAANRQRACPVSALRPPQRQDQDQSRRRRRGGHHGRQVTR